MRMVTANGDRMLGVRISVFVFFLTAAGFLQAGFRDYQIVFSSGPQRVALIELYTSEGCSSCPPADRWLSSLKDDDGLWEDYVPVAFHVDYWNYIGWEDRFSRRAFSDRQRRYADEGGTRVVYTPGFFRHGKDWRGWRNGGPGVAGGTLAGDLTVRIDRQSAQILFEAGDDQPAVLIAHIALLGMNLETRVRAGENKGRRLRHDFVALGLSSVRLERTGTVYRLATRLPELDSEAQDLALAVWISTEGSQAPIQAAGGYLPPY